MSNCLNCDFCDCGDGHDESSLIIMSIIFIIIITVQTICSRHLTNQSFSSFMRLSSFQTVYKPGNECGYRFDLPMNQCSNPPIKKSHPGIAFLSDVRGPFRNYALVLNRSRTPLESAVPG